MSNLTITGTSDSVEVMTACATALSGGDTAIATDQVWYGFEPITTADTITRTPTASRT
ncbi:MAG: hypothetical protein JRD89_21255 [Deltaproteobacteria bacterium]|nr:hypothetical protein [Deltaproteobacteria bacterium]